MDAFHFDDAVLEQRGDRQRKGAPHTFDVVAFQAWVELLRRDVTNDVSIPVFDRSLELTRNCAEIVAASQRILLVEGNYLLLDVEPWRRLQSSFDLTVWLATPIDVVEERIVQRWVDHGLSRDQAVDRATTNDLPNAQLVIEGSGSADLTVAHAANEFGPRST